MHNVKLNISFFLTTVLLLSAALAFAGQASQQNQTGQQAQQAQQAQPADPAATAANQIVDRIVAREAILAARMKNAHPLVETYLQSLDKDDALTFHPVGDQYFLGKLDFAKEEREQTMLKKDGIAKGLLGKVSQLYSVKYLPGGFAQMLVVSGHFDRKSYDFEYIRREFLGEVRTLVFDVKPKKGSNGTFKGRIWAEDQEYNIVRVNGTYGPSTATKMFFHFDSWREYMGKGEWLPAYVYTEESDMAYLGGARHLRFKGQTRLWGYNVGKASAQNELTALIVESDQVKDNVDEADGISPVRALREWQRDAEDNIIQRLEKASLIAPDGEVNKILETVATNLEVTNNLNIEPEVRARVLLTSPLESFTIGHTIVLSRGLIDVLPDEASLAMIIAHELAHIALGHTIDTKYSFNDRMLFEDPEAFQKIHLKRDDKEEIDADKKAAEFLKNSPYKDKLGNAGLFLKAVDERAPQLDHLLLAHIGNAMVKGSQVSRMADLKQGAPKLEMGKVDQIAALPLGGRVRIDPWSAKIELVKAKPVALISAREKMPFEVTPVFLYLTRQTASDKPKTAANAPATTAQQPVPADPGQQPTAVKQ
jgi:Peptidase family M48